MVEPQCATPHTVEWRFRPSADEASGPTPGQSSAVGRPPRAAVCLLGVARFIDWTYRSIEHHLLQRVGVPHDIYAFVSAGQEEHTCDKFYDVEGEPPGVWHSRDGRLDFLASAMTASEDWHSLSVMLKRAVAGRIDWNDRPLTLLENSDTWRRSLRRPGGWIGGVLQGGKNRAASGLYQLRALQWCADAVRWQEENALGYQYSHLIFARWDMTWAIPFPGVPLLSSINPTSVWLPITNGAFFQNDRFALVPRSAMGPYFEGWKLVVSGEADDAFEAVMPFSGVPVFDMEWASTEAFLYVRLRYARVPFAHLPPMSFVQCVPGDMSRSRSHHMCTPFSFVFGGWTDEATKILGGTKYPSEIDGLLLTDYILHPNQQDRQMANKLVERVTLGTQAEWTAAAVDKAVSLNEEVELEELMKLKGGFHRPQPRDVSLIPCLGIRRRLLETNKQWHALDLAREAVLAAPLHLQHWLWLTVLLANHPIKLREAATAAVREASRLNPAHIVVKGLSNNLAGISITPGSLDEALGGPNATHLFLRNSVRYKQGIVTRHHLQAMCATHGENTPAGLKVWLQYGDHFLKSKWVAAAVGVLMNLEFEYLADTRPEAIRLRAEAVARVRDFSSRISDQIEWRSMANAYLVGVSLPLYRQHAPTRAQLLDAKWLEKQEALALKEGQDLRATGFMEEFSQADLIRKHATAHCFGPNCEVSMVSRAAQTYLLLGAKKRDCPHGSAMISTVPDCQNAYDDIRAIDGLSSTRGMQVGSFSDLPIGCSVQYAHPQYDQAPYFNTATTSDFARLETGEFRSICSWKK